MGRTNLLIAALGLAACVLLSVMMKRMVMVQVDQNVDPVVKQLDHIYHRRFESTPRFVIEARGAVAVGVLTLFPKLEMPGRRLAREAAGHVWSMRGTTARIDTLEVVVELPSTRQRRYEVSGRGRVRELNASPARPR